MKDKYFLGLMMVLCTILIAQPIFAEPQMHRTSLNLKPCYYADYYDQLEIPYHVRHVYTGEYDQPCGYKFVATAFLTSGRIAGWGKLGWRYVNFDLYIVNADGTNGECIFHDRKLTHLLFHQAISEEMQLPKDITYPAGKCSLVATYEGNTRDHLEPSESNCTIYVVGKCKSDPTG